MSLAIYAPDLALAVALSISTHGREILDGLEYIKRHKTPPQELLDQTPSPRPANARLPAGWRDKEVAQFDPRRQQGRVVPPVAASAAMDYDTGASSFATGQDEHGLQNELAMKHLLGTSVESSRVLLSTTSRQRLTRALDCQRAGSKEMIRKDVEVRVTRIPHTFHKDELRFERNGRIQSSTEDDWAKGKRDSRTVWFYRHGKKTVYWTK
ncbi:8c19150e-132d-418c-b26e-8e8daf827059 [Thermothielavioides terrestris]|uniref:8c19150e-132d-418c-b26e-8e8daf827059 n=1 Tax=Thermothielavioides terrestris TaxID=2587410 RepID=A0A446BKL4_9PEZI|nr:8c19150e-132d-418c-b26e-8e8daf827059 [Thermothielavioides terrestris]